MITNLYQHRLFEENNGERVCIYIGQTTDTVKRQRDHIRYNTVGIEFIVLCATDSLSANGMEADFISAYRAIGQARRNKRLPSYTTRKRTRFLHVSTGRFYFSIRDYYNQRGILFSDAQKEWYTPGVYRRVIPREQVGVLA